MSNALGLTEQEQIVMNKINECYGEYLKLDKQHPDDIRYFVDGIHILQGMLAMRVVRREYPNGWATYTQL